MTQRFLIREANRDEIVIRAHVAFSKCVAKFGKLKALSDDQNDKYSSGTVVIILDKMSVYSFTKHVPHLNFSCPPNTLLWRQAWLVGVARLFPVNESMVQWRC